MVTEQLLPDWAVQPDQITVPHDAVSPKRAPTGNIAMQGPDGQLIPPVRLVTVPGPETCTLTEASVPPPGHNTSTGLFTVTGAGPTTRFPFPPVASLAVAEMSATPQSFPFGAIAPVTPWKLSNSNSGTSVLHVTCLVMSFVAGGWISVPVAVKITCPDCGVG